MNMQIFVITTSLNAAHILSVRAPRLQVSTSHRVFAEWTRVGSEIVCDATNHAHSPAS